MTQLIQAVYEHGVFRPLQPVQLPENERVVLTVSDAANQQPGDANNGPHAISAEVIERQREALIKLRTEMDSLPCEAPQDGLGGADHDAILYGWQK